MDLQQFSNLTVAASFDYFSKYYFKEM